jgi:aspartokinase/homoserine dehydrogenase 2
LQAQAEGLTEPDPRDDLSGKDVQRKLLVLSRELGLTLDINDIALTPLLPAGLEQGSWDDFWQQRDVLDQALAATYASAKAEGKVLRYVATLTVTEQGPVANVQLLSVTADHPLAAIQACDNVFVIESGWYQANPLVLKGPGAGRLVTAGGIHADLAILARQQMAAAKAARHSQAQAAAWANERA